MSPLTRNPFYLELGQNVRYYRLLAGLTQADFGRGIGYSPQQVCYFENGTARMYVRTLVDVARVLGVSVSDLLPVGGREARALPATMRPAKARRRRAGA